MTVLNQNGSLSPNLSGTSLSAPLVSGLAALISDRTQLLYESPEAVRAITMATAWNNIEGPAGIPTGQDLKDGAGAIDASSADAAAAIGYTDYQSYPYPACPWPCWWSNSVTSSDFDIYNYRYYKFSAKLGERVRVALAWDSNPMGPGGGFSTDPLQTNFDLVILDPDMELIPGGYSASWDNNYELVDFNAPKTGVYTIGVYKHRMDEVSNWIGLAWSKDYLICYLPLVLTSGSAAQSTSGNPYPVPGDETVPEKKRVSPYPAP